MTSIKDTFVQAVEQHHGAGTADYDPYLKGFRYAYEAIGAGLEAVLMAPPAAFLGTDLSSEPVLKETYASKLMREHGITEDDLVKSARAATFINDQQGEMFDPAIPPDRTAVHVSAPAGSWLPNPKHLKAVAVERTRQIAKGYDAAHDDEHKAGEIARGAAAYAMLSAGNMGSLAYATWPWDTHEPPDLPREESITRAIAMLFAELERLERAADKLVPESDDSFRARIKAEPQLQPRYAEVLERAIGFDLDKIAGTVNLFRRGEHPKS